MRTGSGSLRGEYTIHTLDSAEEPKALLIGIEGSDYEYYFAMLAERQTQT